MNEDYVSFEAAKLLKEKRFEGECSRFYMPNGNGRWKYGHYHDFDISDRIECPTLQMAMKWLRKRHHIYIQINLYLVPKGYGADIIHIDSMDTLAYVRKEDESQYDTYEQAAEAAIKYCLENLI